MQKNEMNHGERVINPPFDLQAEGWRVGDKIGKVAIAAINAREADKIDVRTFAQSMGDDLRAAEAALRGEGASEIEVRKFSNAAGRRAIEIFHEFRQLLAAPKAAKGN